jgi:hypothetical protein
MKGKTVDVQPAENWKPTRTPPKPEGWVVGWVPQDNSGRPGAQVLRGNPGMASQKPSDCWPMPGRVPTDKRSASEAQEHRQSEGGTGDAIEAENHGEPRLAGRTTGHKKRSERGPEIESRAISHEAARSDEKQPQGDHVHSPQRLEQMAENVKLCSLPPPSIVATFMRHPASAHPMRSSRQRPPSPTNAKKTIQPRIDTNRHE